jgi:Protein of unknown function (DUF2971)
MILYHYMRPEFVLDTILNDLIKISTMESVNDPNEMIPAFIDQNGWKAPNCLVREDMQKKILMNTGMMCLSATVSSPGMWTHYADKHKGVAFQFDFPSDVMQGLHKVDYTDERVVINQSDDLNNRTVRNDILLKLIKTKATCWCCEQEYRWVFLLQNKQVLMHNGLFYLRLPRRKWTGIILGNDCRVNENVVQKALYQKGFPKVMIGRSKCDDVNFGMQVEWAQHSYFDRL